MATDYSNDDRPSPTAEVREYDRPITDRSIIHDLVWKGRLIIKQDGYVDLPPDRQEIEGPSDTNARRKFIDLLNDATPQAMLFGIIKEKLKSGEIRTRERNDVVLYDREHEGTHWLITGNSNASHGYFYAEARIVTTPPGAAEDKYWLDSEPHQIAYRKAPEHRNETERELAEDFLGALQRSEDAEAVKTPSVLMQRFLDGAAGRADVDMVSVLWDIFADVRSSFRLAMEATGVSKEAIHEVDVTVQDYLTNNYGDE
jgi:hypothetical protein